MNYTQEDQAISISGENKVSNPKETVHVTLKLEAAFVSNRDFLAGKGVSTYCFY